MSVACEWVYVCLWCAGDVCGVSLCVRVSSVCDYVWCVHSAMSVFVCEEEGLQALEW